MKRSKNHKTNRFRSNTSNSLKNSDSFGNNSTFKSDSFTPSEVSKYEREFMWTWCESRFLEGSFTVRALVYWIRVKSSLSVFFLLNDKNKELYMVICIHISMKWYGYDEMFKCNFLRDLKEIYKHLRVETHQDMEIQVLNALCWDLW